MSDKLYAIDSVQVYGNITGPRQVVVLKLGIEGEDNTSKSFILTEWGAQAIMNSLDAAGIKVTSDETEQEHTHEDGTTHSHGDIIEAQIKA